MTVRRIESGTRWPFLLTLAGFGCAVVPIIAPWVRCLPPIESLHALSRSQLSDDVDTVSSYILQLSGAAGLIVGGALFLSAQSASGLVSTRRFRRALLASRSAVACFLMLGVLVAYAFCLRLIGGVASDAVLRKSVGWSLLTVPAVFLLIAGLFWEQATLADPYHLARLFARDINVRSIRRFAFLSGEPSSMNVERYNLDYISRDPLGSLSELFAHAIAAHDRILLQIICDNIAARVVHANQLEYFPESLSSIRDHRFAGRRFSAKATSGDSETVAVYVMHFFVRNAANVAGQWESPSGRHPFVLACLNLLRSVHIGGLSEHTASVIAEGLSAIMLSSLHSKSVASREPSHLVPVVAQDLYLSGYRKAAGRLLHSYAICQLRGNAQLFPAPALGQECQRVMRQASAKVAADPAWLPGQRRSLWLSMLPELEERSHGA